MLRQYPSGPKFYFQPSCSKHLLRMHQMASTTLPTSHLRRTCSAMGPEQRALINQRLALMNREDLYVIVVVLVVSSTGRTCVLTYCYASDGMLKRNGEETCLQVAASHGKAKVTADMGAVDQLAAAGSIPKSKARHSKWPQHSPGPHRLVRGINQGGIADESAKTYTGSSWRSMLKRNPEETSQYSAASFGIAQVISVRESGGFSENPLSTNGCKIRDGLSLTVNIKDLLAARNGIRFHLGTQRASYGSLSDVSLVGTNDPFPAVARMEVSDTATDALTRQLQHLHAFCKCWRLLQGTHTRGRRPAEGFGQTAALLATCITGRTCVLTYCYASDGVLKRNGEETCLQIAASHCNAKVTADLGAVDQLAAAGSIPKGAARHSKWPQHPPGPHRLVRGVNQAVLLMNREDLYGILVAQVVSNTRCTTVLAYDFTDDCMLRRNPEVTSQYIAASFGVAQVVSVRESAGFSENPLSTNGCKIRDGLSLTVNIKDLLAARNGIRFHLGTQRASYGSLSDVSLVGTNDPFPAVARMEVSDTATDALTRQLQRLHAFCKCWRLLQGTHTRGRRPAEGFGQTAALLATWQRASVLINREGLYVIAAVLGVSTPGCACVLTYSFTKYSFTNYNELKRNAEEMRQYIPARSSVTPTCAPTRGTPVSPCRLLEIVVLKRPLAQSHRH
ncbi:hypothetical protein MTO96_010856 [Rhipicephalus appendiculatus]